MNNFYPKQVVAEGQENEVEQSPAEKDVTPGRLHNLDYLRGLAAFGIMIYHFASWTWGDFDSSHFLGRVSISGVSIFYVLSGLTLYYVYQARMQPTISEITGFARKRFFRIYPLLWLATLSSIVLSLKWPDWSVLFLNLTGLFGVVTWDTYFSTGAWSIGNEIVFYLFFPLFIFLKNRSRAALIVLTVLVFIIYLNFTFNVLHNNASLADQWRNYVNPLNQLFLFLGGFWLGMLFKEVKISTTLNLLLLCGGLGLFIFYPVHGEVVEMVTGINRLVFTLSCLMICLAFYKTTVKLPFFIDKPLALLGESSYSVYLIHPIVHSVILIIVSKLYLPVSTVFIFIISIITTLFLSYFMYERFEKYFIGIGHLQGKKQKK